MQENHRKIIKYAIRSNKKENAAIFHGGCQRFAVLRFEAIFCAVFRFSLVHFHRSGMPDYNTHTYIPIMTKLMTVCLRFNLLRVWMTWGVRPSRLLC